jgi:hypothetical protein
VWRVSRAGGERLRFVELAGSAGSAGSPEDREDRDQEHRDGAGSGRWPSRTDQQRGQHEAARGDADLDREEDQEEQRHGIEASPTRDLTLAELVDRGSTARVASGR